MAINLMTSFLVYERGVQDDFVYVEVTLSNKDQSFYYPVQARVEHDSKKFNKQDAALYLVDYIEQYFFEFFQEESSLLPIDWGDFEYNGVDLQLKGQIYNLAIEKRLINS